MGRKKTQLDEFAAMADVHKIVMHFDSHARARIMASVEGKISAEAPKKRVRKKAGACEPAVTLDIRLEDVAIMDSQGKLIQ